MSTYFQMHHQGYTGVIAAKTSGKLQNTVSYEWTRYARRTPITGIQTTAPFQFFGENEVL
jgi:hypothetical protein